MGIVVLFVGQMLSNHMAAVFRRESAEHIRSMSEAVASEGDVPAVIAPVTAGELEVRFSWALDVVQTAATIGASVPVTLVVAAELWGQSELVYAVVGLLPMTAYLWISKFDPNRYAAKSQRTWPILGRVSPGFRVCLTWYLLLILAVSGGMALRLAQCELQLGPPAENSVRAVFICPAD